MPSSRWCAALLMLATLAGALPALAAAAPLAVLAAVKGRVQVVRGSNPAQPAGFGMALEQGDQVVVPAGGAATVFFNDGNVIELSEKSRITVGGKVPARPRVGPGSDLSGEVYSNVSRFVTGGSAQTGLVAMATVRGSDTSAPILLAPRNSGLLDSRPSFAWRAVEGATRYRVSVTGENGELWNREVDGLALDYPANADFDVLHRVVQHVPVREHGEITALPAGHDRPDFDHFMIVWYVVLHQPIGPFVTAVPASGWPTVRPVTDGGPHRAGGPGHR